MVMEMLSHKTPPSCIPANILTIATILCPQFQIVEELPSVSFVRKCRSALVVETKTLGAFLVAKSERKVEHHADATKRRHVDITNSIVRCETDIGVRPITLSSSILCVNETAEMVTEAITRTFKEGVVCLTTGVTLHARCIQDGGISYSSSQRQLSYQSRHLVKELSL